MRIYIQVKKLGRRCCVEAVPFELDIIPATVGELLEEVVLRIADNYNANLGANDILSCISDSAIHDMAVSGKVGFGVSYNDQRADTRHAVDNAIQSYVDGIYRLFINDSDTGCDPTASLTLSEGDILTFVRLTMLSGRLW